MTDVEHIKINKLQITSTEPTDLDPGAKHHEGKSTVEGQLPWAKPVEVVVLVGIAEDTVEQTIDIHGTVDVEGDTAIRNHEDDKIKDIPEFFQVGQTKTFDLNKVDWCRF